MSAAICVTVHNYSSSHERHVCLCLLFSFAKDSQFGVTPELNSRSLSCSAYLKALCRFDVNWRGVSLTLVLNRSLVLTHFNTGVHTGFLVLTLVLYRRFSVSLVFALIRC